MFGHGIFYIRIDYIWNRFCKMPQFSMTLHNFLQKVGSLFYSWHMSWTKSLYVCLQVDPKRLQGFIFLISILIFVYFLKYKTIVLYVLQFSLLIFFCLGSVCWVLNSKKNLFVIAIIYSGYIFFPIRNVSLSTLGISIRATNNWMSFWLIYLNIKAKVNAFLTYLM